MMGRRLRLVRPPVAQPRTEAAALIERHAGEAGDWFADLVQAYNDPSASARELADFSETALSALEARVAALRADLRSGDR